MKKNTIPHVIAAAAPVLLAAGVSGAFFTGFVPFAENTAVISAYADSSCSFLTGTQGASPSVKSRIADEKNGMFAEIYDEIIEQLTDFTLNSKMMVPDSSSDEYAAFKKDTVDSVDYAEVVIDVRKYGLYAEDKGSITSFASEVIQQNPQFYWTNSSNSVRINYYSYVGEPILKIRIRYALDSKFTTAAARSAANADMQAAINAYKAELDQYDSKYEKLRALNDRMVLNVDYVSGSPQNQNAYGALVNRKCVCNGYSKGFMLIANSLGIADTVHVTGTMGGGSHAWNGVNIGGKWYYVDVTSNDPFYSGTNTQPNTPDKTRSVFLIGSSSLLSSTRSAQYTIDPDNKIAKPSFESADFDISTYEEPEIASISDLANMQIGESLSYNYIAEVDDPVLLEKILSGNGAAATLTVTLDGAVSSYVISPTEIKSDAGTSYLNFRVDIPAKNISDPMTAKLSVTENGTEIVSDEVTGRSAADYLTKLANDTTQSAINRSAAVSLLNYAASVQTYKKMTSSLANSGLTDAQKNTAAVTAADINTVDAALMRQSDEISLQAVTVDMQSKVNIRAYYKLGSTAKNAYNENKLTFYYILPNGTVGTMTIGASSENTRICQLSGDTLWVELPEGISPKDYGRQAMMQLSCGDIVGDSFYYSVLNYISSKTASGEMGSVVSAMYRYYQTVSTLTA